VKFTAAFLRKRSLARAVLVVDENLTNLVPELQKKNFRVLTPPKGTPDEKIISDLLAHRTLVTNNPKDFEAAVPVEEFSIIDTTAVTKDGQYLSAMISDAWIEFSLNSQAKFILRLQPDGKHKLELPE
jgi:hypothetical protein